MSWSTIEQLKALKALNPSRVAALTAAGFAMSEKYAGHHVAYTNDWHGDELARTIVIATCDPDEFYRRLAALAPDVRRRVEVTRIPVGDAFEVGSLFFDPPSSPVA